MCMCDRVLFQLACFHGNRKNIAYPVVIINIVVYVAIASNKVQ